MKKPEPGDFTTFTLGPATNRVTLGGIVNDAYQVSVRMGVDDEARIVVGEWTDERDALAAEQAIHHAMVQYHVRKSAWEEEP